MAGRSSGEGRPLYGGAVPFRSHQGLIARAVARSDEMVLQIDLEDGDSGLDQEVGCLGGQVHQLRNQPTLIKARAGVKNNVRRLHKSIVQYGSNNVVPIIVFALICIFLVYLWYKISG
ncbi:bet1-like protein At4g14600 [Syzygium oleosum]|uniref:bet1-like protein At4g14600 n=1 Tax=Syzygium oleosum TaxID=219896 RepID=UPI0024B95D20|nr:bet1-like protein At4g14600 [Syzygium oleosum]